jgi:hypothetical protein
MRHRLAVASLVGLITVLVVALAPASVAGGKPVLETITFADTFEDEDLSEACGVDVTTTLSGRITSFAFPDRPIGPEDLRTVEVDFLATAGDNTVRFKDVGIDMVRIEPDGTLILLIVGQIPFDFTGVLIIDLETGEAILEPVHFVDTTRVCRLLTR